MNEFHQLKVIYEQTKKLALTQGSNFPEFKDWVKQYKAFFNARGKNL